MRACRLCGEEKPFRDRRNYWCFDCEAMYQEMKTIKREKKWQEANRLAIERLRLQTTASFIVTFK